MKKSTSKLIAEAESLAVTSEEKTILRLAKMVIEHNDRIRVLENIVQGYAVLLDLDIDA